MALSLAALWAFGGTLLLLTVLLPHPPAMQDPVALGVAGIAFATVGVMLVVPSVESRVFEVITVFGSLLIGVLVGFSGSATSAYAFFYLWLNVHAFHFLPWRRAVLQLLVMAGTYPVAIAITSAQEGERPVHITMVLGSLVVTGAFVGVLKDRVDRLLASSSRDARTDSLTRLLNRRGFDEAFEFEIARVVRGGRHLSLLVADLDHFKMVNDHFGHEAGDDLLIRVGKVLRASQGVTDTVARIGGEEFAIVLPDTDARGAYAAAERLRAQLRDALDGEACKVTVSIGVTSFPEHGQDRGTLMRAADAALYAAKEQGRDRTVVHDADVARRLSQTLAARADAGSQQLVVTMLALAAALDIRDSGTARHSQTVGRYAELTAIRLGLPADRVGRVRLAGILHDIGKIGVPDSVLLKAGPLNADEWVQMKKHPEIGHRLLGVTAFADIREWVLAHHERPDGRGYPNGLQDAVIPLEAKILAVGDAYEAMVNDRVYRPAIGHEAAIVELRCAAGEQFDAHVVEVFIAALDDRGSPSILDPRPVSASL